MSPSLPPFLDPLARGLAGDGPADLVAERPARGARSAAVLALIEAEPEASGADQARLVFVERAHSLRKHAGQIAFPGGAAEARDADLVDTALREASEEIGLDRRLVTQIGRLPAAHVAVSGFDVATVVGWARPPLAIGVFDSVEVASVLRVGLEQLADPENRVMAVHPNGYRGPAFTVEGVFLWGLTAHLTNALLSLGGWLQPWDETRQRLVPKRFLTDRIDGSAPSPDLV